MSIFDKDGNKSYKEYEVSTDSREKITKGILEYMNEEPTMSRSQLDDRRIEKMDKKGYDILKKLAVASVSIIATGAVIIGAINHGHFKKVGKKDSLRDFFSKDGYIKICNDDKPIQIGNYYFDFDDDDHNVVFKKEGYKEYTNLPDNPNGFSSGTAGECDVYSNGRYVYYFMKGYLYKYDLVTKKVKKNNGFISVGNKISWDSSDVQDDGFFRLINIKNGIIYINGVCDNSEGTDTEKCLYEYNIDDKKWNVDLHFELSDDFEKEDNYVLCYKYNQEDGSLSEIYIGKYTAKGIENVTMVEKSKAGLSTYCVEQIFNENKDDLNKKFYFCIRSKYTEKAKDMVEKGEDLSNSFDSEIWDGSEIKVCTFDIETEKIAESVVLNTSTFGYGEEQSIRIYKLSKDYWTVIIDDVDEEKDLDDEKDGTVKFKYYYKTKKFEVIND